MDEKKVKEAIAKEKETIKTLEDVVVSDKTGSLRRWAKDTIENSTIIIISIHTPTQGVTANFTKFYFSSQCNTTNFLF